MEESHDGRPSKIYRCPGKSHHFCRPNRRTYKLARKTHSTPTLPDTNDTTTTTTASGPPSPHTIARTLLDDLIAQIGMVLDSNEVDKLQTTLMKEFGGVRRGEFEDLAGEAGKVINQFR